MDLNRFPLFSMIGKRMAWLGQRQATLAQNIANADTPQYRPRDLKDLDFAKLAASEARRLDVRATRATHLAGTVPRPTFREQKVDETYETSPSGNAVSLEEELMKAAKTQMDYQLMTSLYRKHLGMLRTVLGRSGG